MSAVNVSFDFTTSFFQLRQISDCHIYSYIQGCFNDINVWICFGVKWKPISLDFQVRVLQITPATVKKKKVKLERLQLIRCIRP